MAPLLKVLKSKNNKSLLLSYDFSHNISVGLFHDKKCCIRINLFPCIFVRFYYIGFSTKLVNTQA